MRVFGFLFVFLLIFSCKQKTIEVSKDNSFDIQQNIGYGKSPEQKLDFYLPKNKDSVKGIFVLVHGGGWRGGDKSQLTSFMFSLMQKFPDYAFANINYRLASTTSYAIPNQTKDIDEALTFLVNKSKELKLSPKFILLGNSAGAHLSMLYGYNSLFDSKQRKKVKAIIDIVGPADLFDKGFANYVDYEFVSKYMIDPKSPTPTDVTTRDVPNPVFWISESSPPTLSYYGNQDDIIPLSQKEILDSALTANNVIHESYEFTGGHKDWEKEENGKFLINKMESFLKIINEKK